MKRVLVEALAFAALMLVLAVMAVAWLPQLGWVGQMQAHPGGLPMKFVTKPRASRAACEAGLDKIVQLLKAACPDCQMTRTCARGLTAEQRRLLAGELRDAPVLYSDATLVVYEGSDTRLAQQTCDESARQAKTAKPGSEVRCVPAATMGR